LIPIILQQDERRFERAICRCDVTKMNRKSPRRLLTPVHFAVTWTHSLRILIDKGVDLNPEDSFGRRPIHLATALGLDEAIELLIIADCSLYSPGYQEDVLQHALHLEDPSRERVVHLITAGLTDRHSRLLEHARTLLPPTIFSKLEMNDREVADVHAPRIIEMLTSHGIHVPDALEVSGESVYVIANCNDTNHLMRMTPAEADVFWNAGFIDVDMPDANGLTPMLQNAARGDFDMVAWFVGKGAAITSIHRDGSLTALHLYANRLRSPGIVFSRSIDAVPTNAAYMTRMHQHFGIPHDNCTCLCSPTGCTPTRFLLVNHAYESLSLLFQKWVEKTVLPASLLPEYIRDFTRQVLFEFVHGKHTCCHLHMNGAIVAPLDFDPDTDDREWEEPIKLRSQHIWFCAAGIPVRRRDAHVSQQNHESMRKNLENWMSLYDNMLRPPTMPPEEQPLHFIRWLIIGGYIDSIPVGKCNYYVCQAS
jgi:ankyrin repeat protein